MENMEVNSEDIVNTTNDMLLKYLMGFKREISEDNAAMNNAINKKIDKIDDKIEKNTETLNENILKIYKKVEQVKQIVDKNKEEADSTNKRMKRRMNDLEKEMKKSLEISKITQDWRQKEISLNDQSAGRSSTEEPTLQPINFSSDWAKQLEVTVIETGGTEVQGTNRPSASIGMDDQNARNANNHDWFDGDLTLRKNTDTAINKVKDNMKEKSDANHSSDRLEDQRSRQPTKKPIGMKKLRQWFGDTTDEASEESSESSEENSNWDKVERKNKNHLKKTKRKAAAG